MNKVRNSNPLHSLSEQIGDFIQYWGFKKIHGMIWTHLYLSSTPLSAHELIQKAIQNINLPLAEKGGEIVMQLNAKNDLIMADEVHFTNIINNLLDNAIKYSGDIAPKISISSRNMGNQVQIVIEDNGIGMSKETLTRIFEKFYRAHTGNLHNVKGFGLGLTYVKTMVEAHQGQIKAESTIGKGSTFYINFPVFS
jgi:two-component system phosphate regulon sensor histidine kinase PhoR